MLVFLKEFLIYGGQDKLSKGIGLVPLHFYKLMYIQGVEKVLQPPEKLSSKFDIVHS